MQTMAQVGVILSAVGVVGSVGGYEAGMYGISGWILRTVIFFVAMVMCYQLEIKMAKKRACVRSRASTTAVCRRSEVKRSDCAQMRATHEREQAVVDTKKKASGNRNFPKARKNNKYEVICHR